MTAAFRASALVLCVLVVPAFASAAEGRYIVKMRDRAAGHAALARANARVVLELPELGAVAAHIPDAAVPGLQRSAAIEYIDVDAKRYPSAQSTPYGIDLVQAPQVWPQTNGGGVKVCIIDSGLYTGHADLQDTGVTGYPSNWNTDGCGHGSHVAGTIAGLNNSEGVVGVNPNGVPLHIVRVFGDTCSWVYASTLVDAAYRCRDAGAKVISMSLGGGRKDRTEDRAFADLYNNYGILSVAAAGNDGTNRLSYPASYTSVVSVAAVDSNAAWASFSQYNSEVELAAPGVAVLSTVTWSEDNSLTVAGVTYAGNYITNAARGAASGGLVDGGLCTSAGSWSGKVVLCARGSISFYDKVMSVQSGGGAAAIIYNNEPGDFFGTLGDTSSSQIPAISLSQENGLYLVGNQLGATGTVSSEVTSPASGYEAWDGTSMATPHVSGVAALVWSYDTRWTNTQIREALTQSARDLGAAGRDVYTGYGLVQAKAALDYLAGSGGGGTTNSPPAASFTYACTELVCNFTDTSTDADGSIVSWSWSFGSTVQNPTHEFAAAGTYAVSLEVTDDAGATASTSHDVTVTTSTGGQPPAPIELGVAAYKVKGVQYADLAWAGAGTAQVDIFRDGVLVALTANDGAYTETTGAKGGGTAAYQVCEAGTSTCSAVITVVW